MVTVQVNIISEILIQNIIEYFSIALWKSPLYNPNPGMNPYQPVPINPNIEVIHGQQYQIEKQLGKGSFGAVFAARRVSDGKNSLFNR